MEKAAIEGLSLLLAQFPEDCTPSPDLITFYLLGEIEGNSTGPG